MRFHLCGAKGDCGRHEEMLEALNEFCAEKDCDGQIIDARMVFGRLHICSAFSHAERAFAEGKNSSRSLANEILLYASGERQISRAIEKMGINETSTEFCIYIVGEADLNELLARLRVTRDDTLLEGRVENLETFGISKREFGSVPRDMLFDLVLEKVAMVDIMK